MTTANLLQNPLSSKPKEQRLRAIIEIDGDKVEVFPVAESDADERAIRDALRFLGKDFQQ